MGGSTVCHMTTESAGVIRTSIIRPVGSSVAKW